MPPYQKAFHLLCNIPLLFIFFSLISSLDYFRVPVGWFSSDRRHTVARVPVGWFRPPALCSANARRLILLPPAFCSVLLLALHLRLFRFLLLLLTLLVVCVWTFGVSTVPLLHSCLVYQAASGGWGGMLVGTLVYPPGLCGC